MQIVTSREPSAAGSNGTIRAEPVPIQWHESLPVFASEDFLRAVGDEYGWLGGIDEDGTLRCFLPFTIVRKMGLRMVRFRLQTTPCGPGLDVGEEKSFLNSVVQYFRSTGVDVIIPGTNNAIFRTYPDGADAAPYGSYVIDLEQPENILWGNIKRETRRNIRTASRDGVSVREGEEYLEAAYDLIRDTFRRSRMSFMDRDAFTRFALGLGRHAKVMMAEYRGVPQSYCLFGFSDACAYGIYNGNVEHQHQGAMKLIQWEAIRLFRSLGVRKLDFFGARINPKEGSKQEGMNMVKRHLGATLSEGYMWKCSLRPWRGWVYSIAVRLLRGGDVVDQERGKLNGAEVENSNGAPK